jgi:RHS repeat-associated protein
LEEHQSLDGQPLALTATYCYGHALLSQTRHSPLATTHYYGCDGHGNVRYLTDALGQITDTYDYDAFGNLIARTGATPINYLFAGEQYDSDLGLYYLRARYHNPITGRFWTMDNNEGHSFDPLSLHKYFYANADPVNLIDPSGRNTTSLAELTIADMINASLENTLAVIVIGVYLHNYSTREWTISSGLEFFPTAPFVHAYMLALKSSGGGFRYDVGVRDPEVRNRIFKNALLFWLHFPGELVRSSATSGGGLPVAKLSDRGFGLWNDIIMSRYYDEFQFSLLNSNCLTWTVGASATAILVSFITF